MPKKKEEESKIGNYFIKEKPLEFISSGCTLLDCILGGGFPIGRISNIIGDSSSNKTGVSIEAMANFRRKYPTGYIWYQDAEAAFDVDYAKTIGLPEDDRTFVIDDVRDINETYELMMEAVETVTKENSYGIYVIDTLDALIPLKDELSEGYDAAKRAALINSLITNIAGEVDKANIHLMVVSQIRENIGVMFGSKYRVAGGKALGFYASQRLWLTEVGKLTKTIKGIKRVYGITVKAKTKKNKISFPFRECEIPVIFSYGMDDKTCSLDFLKSVKGGMDGVDESISKEELDERVKKIWNETEAEFIPKERKY